MLVISATRITVCSTTQIVLQFMVVVYMSCLVILIIVCRLLICVVFVVLGSLIVCVLTVVAAACWAACLVVE